MSRKSIKLSQLLVLSTILFLISSLGSCDGFKLRDRAESAKSGTENQVTRKRNVFKDAPMKKIVKIVKIQDDDEDDEENEENDDEDDEKKSGYIFEKAHKQNFDIPKRDIEIALQKEEDEEVDAEIEENKINFFGIFGGSDDDKNNTSSGFFNFFRNIRKTKDEIESKTNEEKKSSEFIEESKDWMSYLNRMPFNLIYDFNKKINIDGEAVTQTDNQNKALLTDDENDDEIKHSKSKEPMNVDTFDRLLLEIPSFTPNYSKIHNIDCRRQGQIFQRQLRGQKNWALQMMDASAKIPSGLMRGNANQLGDFDMCVDIATKIKVTEEQFIRMRGKYCLAQVDVVATVEDLKVPVYLMQGRNFLRSSLNDPSHFIPRFTTLNWGICLPSACTHEDANKIIRDAVKQYNSTGIKINVSVEKDNCLIKQNKNWSDIIKNQWQISATLGYYIFIIVVMLIATLNDYWTTWKLDVIFADHPNKKENGQPETVEAEESQEKISENNSGILHNIFMSFSIKRTGLALFGPCNDEIKCLHGIKAFGTITLFISLKVFFLARIPYTNRIYFTESFNSPFTVFFRAFFIYTDIFLFISGTLAAFQMSKDYNENGKIQWIRRILGKLIRTVPSLLAVVLFYAWIWEHLNSGPQWGDLVVRNANLCKTEFWKNILQIQNWFSFEETCATHTNQLSLEFQLSLLAPVIIWFLHKNPIIGFSIFGTFQGISSAMRYSSTIENRLSSVLFHGVKISQLYRTANFSHLDIFHRATPYMTGIGLGVLLSQTNKNIKLPKGFLVFGWFLTFWAICWCFWTPSNASSKDFQYDPSEMASYSAWASLVWSLGLSWIVFCCFTENGSYINHVLCSKPLLFLSRISFSVYLIQFVVFFSQAGTIRGSEQFRMIASWIDWIEITVTLLASIILTMLFDIPFQQIKKLILISSIFEVKNSIDDKKQEETILNESNEEIEDIFAKENNKNEFLVLSSRRKDSYEEPNESLFDRISDDENFIMEEEQNVDDVQEEEEESDFEEDEEEEEDEEISEEQEIVRRKSPANNIKRWSWSSVEDE